MIELSDPLEIRPAKGPIRVTVSVPGSKSLTNRALVIGALADGKTLIRDALESDDTELMVVALAKLGLGVDWNRAERTIRIVGRRGEIPVAGADLYGGNAGTTVRFLVSLVALGQGRFRVDGDPRMRERPIGDLLVSLSSLGVSARSEGGNGCPPVVVEAHGIRGGRATVAGKTSSQFASSILLAAPYARTDVTLEIRGGLVGAPFVEMTLEIMRRHGITVRRTKSEICIPGGQRYRAGEIRIEPDATAASYFLAAAALTSGVVKVRGLGRDSLQGDIRFIDALTRMGASTSYDDEGITVTGHELRGIDYDFCDISDTFLTAAVLAPFASSPTVIRGIGHTRHQETDRVAAVARELGRLGVAVREHRDALEIRPSVPHGGEVETYNDHRMAMSFALIGLRVPGIRIRNPACVRKTFPDYFDRLEAMRHESAGPIR